MYPPPRRGALQGGGGARDAPAPPQRPKPEIKPLATRSGPAASPGALGPGSSRRAGPSRSALPGSRGPPARPGPAPPRRPLPPPLPGLSEEAGGAQSGGEGRARRGRRRESVSRTFPARQLLPPVPPPPGPVTQAGVCCSVCTSESARTRLRHGRRIIRFFIHGELGAHTRPPRGDRRLRAADAGADTHPAPGQGVALNARGPHPIPPHPHPHPTQPRRGAPIWGGEIAQLSATPSSPPNPARLGHREPGSRPRPRHPRTGAVRSRGAEEGVSVPWSPPHAPYRGFLDPFCPPGGFEPPPRGAHRDLAARRCPPQSPT